MATVTMTAFTSTHSACCPRPSISSPLASQAGASTKRTTPKRIPSFPSSRPLRPFATVSHIFMQPDTPAPTSNVKKPLKMIQPPKNQQCAFVLNLTQAEFSRQD